MPTRSVTCGSNPTAPYDRATEHAGHSTWPKRWNEFQSTAGSATTSRLGPRVARALRFTPTKAGEYHFHCDVDSHAKQGMMGMLVVVEP